LKIKKKKTKNTCKKFLTEKTHGSGLSTGGLATQVLSVQMVKADGSMVNYKKSDPRLKAVAAGLGAFGVITAIELELVPTYNVTNYVFEKLFFSVF
jgi:xylitol oxidase